MKYARDFREEALAALNGRWGIAVGAGVIYYLLSGGISSFITERFQTNYQFSPEGLLALFATLLPVMLILMVLSIAFSIISSALALGYNIFNLHLLDPDSKPEIGDLFCRFRIIWKAFLLQLMMGLLIFLWSLLFIIPGIIAAYRYSMSTYIMAENPDIGVMEAIDRSKTMMVGNKFRLFCLSFSFIGWVILATFTLGIGYLWLNPYIAAAQAAFYNEISGKNQIRSSTSYSDSRSPSGDFDYYYNNGNDYQNR